MDLSLESWPIGILPRHLLLVHTILLKYNSVSGVPAVSFRCYFEQGLGQAGRYRGSEPNKYVLILRSLEPICELPRNLLPAIIPSDDAAYQQYVQEVLEATSNQDFFQDLIKNCTPGN